MNGCLGRTLDPSLLVFFPDTVEEDDAYFAGGVLSQTPQDIISLILTDQNDLKEKHFKQLV